MNTIQSVLLSNLDKEPGVSSLSLQCGNVAVRYNQLIAMALRYRDLYQESQIPTRSLVAIVSHTSINSVAAFLGAILGNYIPFYLSPKTDKQLTDVYFETLKQLISLHKVSIVVMENGSPVAGSIDESIGSIYLNEDENVDQNSVGENLVYSKIDYSVDANDIAFLQFSSGTTGLRKGIPVSHRALMSQLRSFGVAFELDRHDHIVSWLPLYHDMGLIACCLLPILMRVPVTMLDPVAWSANPVSLFAAVEINRATRVFMPNFAFNHLAYTVSDSPRYDLSSLRSLVNCSEPCRKYSFDLFLDRFQSWGVSENSLQTCYALAEAVFAVSYSRKMPTTLPSEDLVKKEGCEYLFVDDLSGFLSCGFVLPNTEVRILDEGGRVLDQGQLGEIAISGESVFSGYFIDGIQVPNSLCSSELFRTGDLGLIHNGELYVLGRISDVIIVNGRNVFAGDIEMLVAKADGVKKGRVLASAIGNKERGSEDILVLFESLCDMHSQIDLYRHIRRLVAEHFGLACCVVALPPGFLVKTSSGKISRRLSVLRYFEWEASKLKGGKGEQGLSSRVQ